MNERIRELAEQARLEFEYEPGIEPEPVYYGYEKDLEKFAELIVRECAELCLNHAEYEGPFNQMEFRKGQHFNTIIKNHFGVEQ